MTRKQVSRTSFTDEQIVAAYKEFGTVALAAKDLSAEGHGIVSPQLFRYWLSKLDVSESDDYDRARELIKTRNALAENNKLRKDNRVLVDAIGTRDDLIDGMTQAAGRIRNRPPVRVRSAAVDGVPLTVELLLSDLQIGKLSNDFNSDIARARLREFGEAAVFQIEQKQGADYRVERIVLALLGDIIESDKKHPNSARATDTGTAQQISDAISAIFLYVIEPLARLGIPMDIPCITGNHDHDDHGLNMFRPGREHLSYPLYMAMKLITERSGYSHVTFSIVDGAFQVLDIYGQKVLYEHGVGVSVTEAAMKAHKIKRSEQIKDYITYFRMGDKHSVTGFNSHQYVVNGAFFASGASGAEYSEIAGYSSAAAQWMGFHTPRDDARFTLYDSFTIQLGHVTQ